jgi:hypothetical protein
LRSSAKSSVQILLLIASEEFPAEEHYMKFKIQATESQSSRITRNFFDSPGGDLFPQPFPDNPFLQLVSTF